MPDPTEPLRRVLVAVTNAENDDDIPSPKWTTEELTLEFEVVGFMAPFVHVRRRSDGKTGTLMFRHSPRIYFGWEEA